MMRLTRSTLTVCLMSVAAAAVALPAFGPAFLKAYKIPKGSALEKAGCVACHTKGSKLNPFGEDLKKAMKTQKSKSVTPEVLKTLETLDSDKDGVKNLAEITAGTLPGDAKSK